MKNILLSCLLPAALLTSCKKEKGDCGCVSPPIPNCDTVLCTADFRTLVVYLRDAGNQPAVMDSVQTTLTDGTRVQGGGNELGMPAPGCYGVVSDNWVQGHQITATEMRFRAFSGGKIMVDTPFLIGADCCHISKVSGPDTLVVP